MLAFESLGNISKSNIFGNYEQMRVSGQKTLKDAETCKGTVRLKVYCRLQGNCEVANKKHQDKQPRTHQEMLARRS